MTSLSHLCLLALVSSCLLIDVKADGRRKSNHLIRSTALDVYDGCGISKNCVALPEECIESKDCEMLSTFKRLGNNLMEIELYGKISGNEYVAVGFSFDQKMGQDSVIECVQYQNTVEAYQSYNIPGDNNKRLTTPVTGFAVNSTTYISGFIHCQIQHPIAFTNNDLQFDLTQPMYVLMAVGPTNGDNIKEHHEEKSTSSTLSVLAEPFFSSYFKESRILKQLHGSFMVVAWLIAASIGILIPRHMKRTWVGKKFMGKDRWFVYHQGLMAVTWTLTVAAFIIIFIDVDGWVSESVSEMPHPLIGTITTVLAFIQPVMAAFRPDPDATNRYIFNWAHSFVGYSAHILAITCIFLAVEMEEAELRYETYWILTTHICLYVIAQTVLTILAQRKPKIDVIKEEIANRDEQGSSVRQIILGVYSLIIVGLGITVIVFIAVEK